MHPTGGCGLGCDVGRLTRLTHSSQTSVGETVLAGALTRPRRAARAPWSPWATLPAGSSPAPPRARVRRLSRSAPHRRGEYTSAKVYSRAGERRGHASVARGRERSKGTVEAPRVRQTHHRQCVVRSYLLVDAGSVEAAVAVL
eukprot:5951714-Pyramimonas_sp.AAC.1